MRKLLDQRQILGVELVIAELLQGSRNKRERDIIVSYWDYLPKYPLENVLINASINSSKEKWLDKGVGLVDCAILTYSRMFNAKLWTIDKKLLRICEQQDLYLA
jgi:predicted nucleic acid-binding protein